MAVAVLATEVLHATLPTQIRRVGQVWVYPTVVGLLVVLVRIIDAVLDRIDLTKLVLQHVDLDRIIAAADLDAAAARLDVDAVAARLDVNAVVARLDPVAMTESIAEAIELHEIIKTTGSVATGAVRGARVQSTETYGQAKRVVGRFRSFVRSRSWSRSRLLSRGPATALSAGTSYPPAGFGRAGLTAFRLGRSVAACPAQAL